VRPRIAVGATVLSVLTGTVNALDAAFMAAWAPLQTSQRSRLEKGAPTSWSRRLGPAYYQPGHRMVFEVPG
jgi:hypothetical protein